MLIEIFLVHVAAMASPGPNVLVVIRTAIAESRRAGLFCAAGVATGGAIWAGGAALGLGLVIANLPIAYDALRVLGGLYLVYLGVRTARSVAGWEAPPGVQPRASGRRAWRRGLLTNLSNPKAAVFFTSVFATLLPADSSLALRIAAVAVIVVDALLWHALLAIVLSSPPAQARYLRARRRIDGVAGVVMIAFGLRLATDLR
ncbi:MAG: LysE family transporter [Thermoleophilaceae bacterium]|nr:LysE family transporter [Thermoleophilaceae bacterium]